MNKSLIILRGCPGAGKSTLAGILTENGKYPNVCADDFLYEDGVYVWTVDKLHKAHRKCFENTEKYMSNETEKIFISNVFAGQRDLREYYELAEKYDYKVFSIIVENRHNGKSIHGLTDEKLKNIKNAIKSTLKL